jgi:hypothetical protein
MCPAIDNHASCKIGAVIRFLHDKTWPWIWKFIVHYTRFKIKNMTNLGTIRQRCKMFKNEELSGFLVIPCG